VLEKPHKKLDVWKKSMEKGCYFNISKYIRRRCRNTKKEFIQFLHMAQCSLSELDTHLEISLALGYVKEKSLRELSLLMNDVDKMLSGLINSLKR